MKNIVFDLDGTLLEKNLTLSKETADCIKKISRNNIVTIATGRSLVGIPQSLAPLDRCISYYVTTNGAFVYDRNKEIVFKDPIPFENALCFIEEINKYEVFVEILSGNNWHICSSDFLKFASLKLPSEILNYISSTRTKHNDLVSFITQNKMEIDKISVNICFNADKSAVMSAIKKLCKKYDLRYCSDKEHKVDVYRKTTNKGNALRHVSLLCGVDLANTISFGNDENDIELFNVCSFSVCMPTASSRTKRNASYILRKNDESRFLRCIRQIKHKKGIDLFK